MLDWEVNFIDNKDPHHFLLSDIEEDATLAVTSILSMEIRSVETLIDAAHQDDGRTIPVFTPSSCEVDQFSAVLDIISPTLEDTLLYDYLLYRA